MPLTREQLRKIYKDQDTRINDIKIAKEETANACADTIVNKFIMHLQHDAIGHEGAIWLGKLDNCYFIDGIINSNGDNSLDPRIHDKLNFEFGSTLGAHIANCTINYQLKKV